ncbi:hypothetical protein Pla108_27420 [Botrimarina colliarenosi]|uniref:DUF4190 domain-containing protein n=1 Tax=Botrimarina colliarenosi TaxID=2528001 RepID=A0A5C6ACT3_9BACT|nr:hypothetical protein [Botrimarina colliarenosi]TWT96965.1 hypothetical protein Pla108_27420 [Botrimarina colliarenosi]
MDDRLETDARQIGLSDTLDDEAVAYRPVSALAVVGLVLGLASLLSLVTPWLAFLPLAAVAISWAAAHQVQRDPEAQSGLGLAIAGMALSLVVLGALLVQRPVAKWLHQKSAVAVTDRFVELLAENDLVGALELTKPFPDRRPSPELAKVFYESDAAAQAQLEEFTQRAEVQRVAGGELPVRRGPFESASVSGRRVQGIQTYKVPAGAGQEPTTLQIEVERSASPARVGGVAWRVVDYRLAPPAA